VPVQTMLSTTELKDAITYVNPDFITSSGYSLPALLDKHQNNA
jgi:hypothetical protein